MRPADGDAGARLASALRARPGLQATYQQAWARLLAQDDAPGCERWAAGVLALLHANAGALCLTTLFRLRGEAAVLAGVAEHAADICRHAGAAAATACIEAWDRVRVPGLWPGLCRLAREAADCVAVAAGHATTIVQAVGGDGFAGFVALGLKAAGRDKMRRAAFFALADPLARSTLAQGGDGGWARDERSLKLFGAALWGRMPALRPLPVPPGRPPPRRASLSDGVILLPESVPGLPPAAQSALRRATLAHALAHLMAGMPRQQVGTLKPLQLALIGLIEDASRRGAGAASVSGPAAALGAVSRCAAGGRHGAGAARPARARCSTPAMPIRTASSPRGAPWLPRPRWTILRRPGASAACSATISGRCGCGSTLAAISSNRPIATMVWVYGISAPPPRPWPNPSTS
jgi:hypothetical protein